MSLAPQIGSHPTDGTISIPAEILAHIFWLSINPKSQGFLDTRDPPWSTSQVCRRWQDISLSYGFLWTEIRLRYQTRSPLWFRRTDFDSEDERHAVSTVLVHRLSKQLERARGYPLTFEHFSSLVGPLDDALMNTLWEYRSSWKQFEYNLGPGFSRNRRGTEFGVVPVRTWLQTTTTSPQFPALRKLTVGVHGPTPWLNTVTEDFLSLFQAGSAPLLTDLAICRNDHYIHHDITPVLNLALPWHQLTSLTLQGCELNPEAAPVPSILGKLLNLKRLSLSLWVPNAPSVTEITTLPLLAELHLSMMSKLRPTTAACLAWFNAPLLYRVVCHGSHLAAALPDLIERSQCSVEVLHLRGISTPIPSDLLYLCPRLRYFQLYSRVPPPMFDIIRILSGPGTTSAPPCLLLETLHLTSSRHLNGDKWAEFTARNRLDLTNFSLEQIGQITDLLQKRASLSSSIAEGAGAAPLPLKRTSFTLQNEFRHHAPNSQPKHRSQPTEEEARLRSHFLERIEQVVMRSALKVGIYSEMTAT